MIFRLKGRYRQVAVQSEMPSERVAVARLTSVPVAVRRPKDADVCTAVAVIVAKQRFVAIYAPLISGKPDGAPVYVPDPG